MQLSDSTIASLFVGGFLSAGISGLFIGVYADYYGRKRACLTYCLAYSLSCLTMMTNNLPTLFLGRFLGGFSASLLYCSFDSWIVTEYKSRRLAEQDAGSLAEMFGTMTALNGAVAIASGIFSGWLVGITGTMRAPFMASILTLFGAALMIGQCWVGRSN